MDSAQAFRDAAAAYRELLATWTEIGSSVDVPTEDDAILAHPPAVGEERAWLDRLVGRARDWLDQARASAGARRDRIVRRLRRVLAAALRGAQLGMERTADMVDPIKNLQRVLDSEFGAALGGGLALALAIAAIYLLRKRGSEER